MHSKVSLMELFAGGGTLGFALSRGLASSCELVSVAANELEPRYVKHWNEIHPRGETFCGGISKFHSTELSRPFSGTSILAAGIPCTGASLAGRSKNGLLRAEDHQSAGHLFIPTMLYIRRHRPEIVVLENVPAYTKTATARMIRDVLSKSGYFFHEYLVNAHTEFDTPTERKRWILIATLDRRFFWNYSAKPFSGTLEAFLDPEGADPDAESPAQVQSHSRYLSRKQGEGCGWTKVILTKKSLKCPTIVRTYHKKHAVGPWVKSGETYRHLRTREIARLHSFPDSFPLPSSKSAAVEILGQGVAYNPFFSLGRSLGEWIASGKPETALRPPENNGQGLLF